MPKKEPDVHAIATSSKNKNFKTENTKIKDFLDMISPSVVKFNVDHFICGNTFRCVCALREYPTATNEQAILRHLGEIPLILKGD